ncbi:hypothetical protein M8J76_010875 [Diaphorina citri]|nr:hypothetical protein M8J76_010875 [Diaphorina citri]
MSKPFCFGSVVVMHTHQMQSGAALYYSRSSHPSHHTPRPPRPTQIIHSHSQQYTATHSGYPPANVSKHISFYTSSMIALEVCLCCHR